MSDAPSSVLKCPNPEFVKVSDAVAFGGEYRQMTIWTFTLEPYSINESQRRLRHRSHKISSGREDLQAIKITRENWNQGIVVPGFPIPPINTFLGGELISHDPEQGVIRISFPTKPEHANPAGFVMGGITSAFLDNIPGPLTVAATGGTAFPVTLDIHVTYFKPVPIGPRAIAEARIDRLTRSTIFTTAFILDEKDGVLVRAIQTALLKSVG